MLDFFAKPFAIAGAIAAAGPIIIHLLNRRRFRTVSWAAMDFLRQALQRNRRILELRDLILLLLRCFVVLCVGLALARPFFRTTSAESVFAQVWPWLVGVGAIAAAVWAVVASDRLNKFAAGGTALLLGGLAGFGLYQSAQLQSATASGLLSARQPVHAVLLIDNSLSMGYETLEGNLLDRAKARASEFVDNLPPGSRITVIPVCGSEASFSLDAYRNKDDARDALNRIDVVDRSGTVPQALALATEACDKVPEISSKRVVLLSDQQAAGWPAEMSAADLKNLPELQLVQVAAAEPENVWVSDFRIQNGIADIETPSVFLAVVEHEGGQSLRDVQVTLSVDGTSVASQSIDLEPRQSRQVEFHYQIDMPAEPGRPQFVTAEVAVQTPSVEGDRLKQDNRRHLVVPVVAGLPVVFVDQLGPKEDVLGGEVGETYPLRRYLAPRLSRDEFQRQLIQIRHVTIDQVDQELLKDARLVVVGGVADPAPAVEALREYVLQGGPLVITAGADFDSALWNASAWHEGAGILPVPLAETPFGETPEQLELEGRLDDLETFRLDFDTMQHPYFVLENETPEMLEDWYRQTLFFKAAVADVSPESLARLADAQRERLEEARKQLADADTRRAKFEQMQKLGTFGPAEESQLAADEAERRKLSPQWLLWQSERQDLRDFPADEPIEEVLARTKPRILAAFDVQPELAAGTEKRSLPFLVERSMGRGRVLFFSSGTYSSWNTLAGKNSNISLFDRILRSLVEDTLPPRNFDAGERMVLPADPDRRLRYTLLRPDGETETLTVEAVSGEQFGLTIPNAYYSGPYRVTTARLDSDGLTENATQRQVIPLAVNFPPSESQLAALDRETVEQRLGPPGEKASWRWVGEGETISLEGAEIRGRDYWKTLVLLALAALAVEMVVLAWPTLRQRATV